MSLSRRTVKKRMSEWGTTEKEVREIGERMAEYIKKEAAKGILNKKEKLEKLEKKDILEKALC
ncbi:hypothetical protein [Lutibacter sp.]